MNFTPALRLKDVEYALQLAEGLGVPQSFGTVAADIYRRLCAAGFARENESRVIDVVRARKTPAG